MKEEGEEWADEGVERGGPAGVGEEGEGREEEALIAWVGTGGVGDRER